MIQKGNFNKECVAVFIELYKNNVTVSHVGPDGTCRDALIASESVVTMLQRPVI